VIKMATVLKVLTGEDFQNSDVSGATKYQDKGLIAGVEQTVGEFKVQSGERVSIGGDKVFVQLFDNA